MAMRIMIVDDEEVTGRLLLYQLQGLGYQAVYLQDGMQALQRILIEQPDIILLDVMMPLVSGWDVCREIRACSSVPIIMVTGKDSDDDIVAGLAAGADDYVTKPFTMAQLEARIEAVLRRADQRSRWPSDPPRRGATPVLAPAVMLDPHMLAARVAAEPIPQRVERWREHAAPSNRMTLVATPLPVRPEPTQRDSSAGLLGAQLRAARQARGLTLYQAERLCGARWDYLQAIEQESWAALPRAQALQALRQYAGFLRVDVGDLATEPSSRPTWHYAIAVFAIVILVVVLGSVLLSIG